MTFYYILKYVFIITSIYFHAHWFRIWLSQGFALSCVLVQQYL